MGEQLLPVFADVEESVAKLWRAILGLQHELTGTVRLTCTEPVLSASSLPASSIGDGEVELVQVLPPVQPDQRTMPRSVFAPLG
jgi:hypothetical protein